MQLIKGYFQKIFSSGIDLYRSGLNTRRKDSAFFLIDKEADPKGKVSRLAKIRKPQCTDVHEDFRIKRNAENTLLGHPPRK